jgi:hypothetical protein
VLDPLTPQGQTFEFLTRTENSSNLHTVFWPEPNTGPTCTLFSDQNRIQLQLAPCFLTVGFKNIGEFMGLPGQQKKNSPP